MAATSSGPGWSTIATGVRHDLHGVKDNTLAGKHYDQYPDFLTRLENVNAGSSTYAALDVAGHGGSSTEERRTFVLASGPGVAAGARPAGTRLLDVLRPSPGCGWPYRAVDDLRVS
ncbi:hypothetical protein [Nonomuraea sp. NPDC052265]|uniref:hypothetical protein n=1 Tax=Nonomuraea sp. NPDC052265 TaxID=3364374 RepID=UPI0037C70173